MASTQVIVETGERIVETALYTFTMYIYIVRDVYMYVAGTSGRQQHPYKDRKCSEGIEDASRKNRKCTKVASTGRYIRSCC